MLLSLLLLLRLVSWLSSSNVCILHDLCECLRVTGVAESLKVLHHSDVSFHERLYSSFDVDIFCVELYDSLAAILQNPAVYVRAMIPCFDVLIKLNQVCKVHSAA